MTLVDQVADKAIEYYQIWSKVKDIGGVLTGPIGTLISTKADVMSLLAKPGPANQPQFKYCDKEFREIYLVADHQRKGLLAVKSHAKNAGYWIEFSGAGLGKDLTSSQMIRRTDESYRKLRELRLAFDALLSTSQGMQLILATLGPARTWENLASKSPDAVRLWANQVAAQDAGNAVKAIIAYTNAMYPDLDKAIGIVEDMNNSIHRYYKNYYSKFNFVELLKMYVEDKKKENSAATTGPGK